MDDEIVNGETEPREETPWSLERRDAEPEPDWAREIQERRKARAGLLRQILDVDPPAGEEKGSDA